MTRNINNTSGYIVCGACAVPADPNSAAPSSVEALGQLFKGLFSRKNVRARNVAVAAK